MSHSDHTDKSLMNSPENSSVNSTRSSPCTVMEEDELTKSVEQNYRACQELIQQNLVDEKRLNEEIKKEDKKCNLLQYRIETLKKQCIGAEKITADLRKCVFSTQMEMEKIGTEILEQKTAIEHKFPSDGLQFYSEMVNVTAHMVEQMKQLQVSLTMNVEECTRYDSELGQWKETVIQLLDNINRLKIVEQQNKHRLESLDCSKLQDLKDLADLEENTNILNAEFKEYESLKNKVAAVQAKEEGLNELKGEVLRNCQKVEENTKELMHKYNDINGFYQTQCTNLHKQEIAIESDYFKMLKQLDMEFSQVDQLMKTLDREISDKELDLQRLTSKKIQLQKELEEISEQEKQLLQEEEKIKMAIDQEEPEKVDEKLLRTQYEQINAIMETEISSNQGKLTELTKQLELLKIENELCLSRMNKEQSDQDTLMKTFHEKQTIISNTSTIIDQLESEKNQLQMMLEKITSEAEVLECTLNAYTAHCNSLESVWENLKRETDTRSAEINRMLNEYTDCMNSTRTDSYEKQSLMDSIKKDLQEYSNEHIKTLHQIWLVTRENNDKKAELDQIDEKILTEQTEHTNSKNLLQDLQKNTLPTDEIPEMWFQSFEKQKKEFGILFKERTKLEKERNNLIIELDAYGFQKSQSQELSEKLKTNDEPTKPENSKHAKIIYDAFKDRLKRNDSTISTKSTRTSTEPLHLSQREIHS